MPLRWHIDQLNSRRIAGWIDDDGPVAIEIAVNGQSVAKFTPTQYRQDLAAAGIGDGRRSFVFPITRYLIDQNNTVAIRYNGVVLASKILQPLSHQAQIAAFVQTLGLPPARPTEIIFIQTADATKYRAMLQITSRTVIEYCSRHNLSCEVFVGLCRGTDPWHASFNRIVLLRRLLNNGFAGWVCYLDADAFIVDLDFDVRHYLSDKDHLAFITATDNPNDPERPYWAVNSGTFLINLGHPAGRQIVWQWAEKLDDISEDQWASPIEWNFDDQGMLTDVLRNLPNPQCVLTLRDQPNLINYSNGIFIRQILRADLPFSARQEWLRSQTDRVLGLG